MSVSGDDYDNACRESFESGVETERERVLQWLRYGARDLDGMYAEVRSALAGRIEKGEHLKSSGT